MSAPAGLNALSSSEAVRIAREALDADDEAWIVGGAVRDAVLGRPITDLDIAVPADEGQVARRVAAARRDHCFQLSEEFAAWRVADREGEWRIDVVRFRGERIDEDLKARDFTVGAVAVPLHGGAVLDPLGGLEDLERGVLRAVSPQSFSQDPLRILRAARIAADLRLEIEPATSEQAQQIAERAAEPAGERQLVELRLLVCGSDPLRGLALLDELGATAGVMPELEALKGQEQGANHHLDVHGHTLEVLERLLEIEGDLERYAGARAADLAALLAEPLADGMTRGDALRFGALVHDMGKPATAKRMGEHMTFIGHDRSGVEVVAGLGNRLRMSRGLSRHLQALTLNHLRLGFMIPERPLPLRRIHDYLKATGSVAADVTLLTVADRLAAQGTGPIAGPEMVEAHLELAEEMLAFALDWHRDGPPRPLMSGSDLSKALHRDPGPWLTGVMAELEAAQFAGEVTSAREAVETVRRLYAEPG